MGHPVAIGSILAVGALSAIQVGFNNLLGQSLGHPVRAAFANVSVATILFGSLMAVLALRGLNWPTHEQILQIPWFHWLGGICGAAFVMATIALAPRVGASTFAAALIAGELLVTALLDHYGWLGFERHSINPWRLTGLAFLFSGVLLVQK